MKFAISKQSSAIKNSPPGMPQKAKNFSAALLKNTRSFVTGNGWSRPEDEALRYLEICKTCEFYKASHDICEHPFCGCPMKRKARWKTTHCPVGKW